MIGRTVMTIDINREAQIIEMLRSIGCGLKPARTQSRSRVRALVVESATLSQPVVIHKDRLNAIRVAVAPAMYRTELEDEHHGVRAARNIRSSLNQFRHSAYCAFANADAMGEPVAKCYEIDWDNGGCLEKLRKLLVGLMH
ncbi:hypothetical protein Tmz1t_0026 [Thauera aminoaromatica]|uniref:Uncharacterized protein n=2 Tax=Thauera aminoaromatica TaxID=164330 RepID=C4ZID5_THASP|nr:hypothetical protein Tmz1t_0026 [Thauera aminoaromatica]